MDIQVIDKSLNALVSAIKVSFDDKIMIQYPCQKNVDSAWIDKLFVEKQTNKHQQLIPVFSGMFEFKDTTLTLKANPTTLSECFPQTNAKFDQVAKSTTLKQLENEISTFVQGAVTEQTIAQVLAACQKNVSYLPAKTAADYSAYDYIHARAAIEVCDALSNEDEQFCLLEGDISGIQKFIFEVAEGEATRKNVAKSLRGRSAYVNFLSDFISRYILHELKLSRLHLLYSNGGTFQLLLPNTSEVQVKLQNIQSKIESELYNLFGARLAVVFGQITFTKEQLKVDYAQQVQRVKQAVNRQKQKRFISLIHAHKDNFFVQPYTANNETICKQCGVARTVKEACHLCQKLIELGTILVEQQEAYLLFDYENKVQKYDFNIEIGELGSIFVYTQKPQSAYGLAINHKTFGYEQKTMGNAVAKKQNQTLSFEEIAELSQSDTKRLAVLKMDVDNLGYIFSQGLAKEKRQLPRLMNLSRQLDWFFTGYLNELCNEVSISFGHQNAFYINYAGGDDLMIVGPWDLMLHLGVKIQEKFSDYTCENPHFTISGGFEIMKPKQPIRLAAQKAEEALEQVKKTRSKAGISLLGQKFPWHEKDLKTNDYLTKYTYKKLLQDFAMFNHYLDENEISQTLFYNLMVASTNITTNQREGFEIIPQKLQGNDLRAIPQIAYSMNRNLGKSQKSQEIHQELKNRLLTIGDNELPYIQYPFKLVILSQRN